MPLSTEGEEGGREESPMAEGYEEESKAESATKDNGKNRKRDEVSVRSIPGAAGIIQQDAHHTATGR